MLGSGSVLYGKSHLENGIEVRHRLVVILRELGGVAANLVLLGYDLLTKAFLHVGIARHVVGKHGESGGDGVMACESDHAANQKLVESRTQQGVHTPYLRVNFGLGQLILPVAFICFFCDRTT